MSSGVQEGSVRLQKVATEQVRDGAPAPLDCRPTPSPASEAARALRCLSSGYLSDGCPCRSSIPADLVKAAWLQELERGAVPGEGFFRLRWRGRRWLGYGLSDGSVRGVYCPAHSAERDERAFAAIAETETSAEPAAILS
jgi:hypothetical protein